MFIIYTLIRMWWLIQNIIFSICLIVIIHYLYLYFEATLTSPKVKDLIHCPKQEYKRLLESIHKNTDDPPQQQIKPPPSTPNPIPTVVFTDTLGANSHITDDMKSDLKEYIRGLKNSNQTVQQTS